MVGKGVFILANYKVEITGVNTNDLKVLKNKEKTELFLKLQAGDLSAKDELIEGNLRLVLSVLRKFNNNRHNMDDLFQIGTVGLIKAIDNFDLSHGVMFSTYAVPLILGEVKRYIRDNSPIRVSRSVRDLAYKIIMYKEEYFNKYGKDPTHKRICKKFDIEEYEISNAMDALKEPMSIFEPIYSDGGDTIYLLDQIADTKESAKDYDALILLRRALKKIKFRERDVLIDRFLVGRTQMEIAQSLGISQAQVSRIEKNAISNVKKLIK